MKYIVACLMLASLSAHALPILPVKERIKFELWSEGVHTPVAVEASESVAKPLPEEITRILSKYNL